jgi:DHA1 family bicyclomycin/chloramphenicol resistance-like MFS transporter
MFFIAYALCTVAVLGVAVRYSYDDQKMKMAASAIMISVIGAIVAIVPGIAPVMGGYIALFLGWRFIFWTVAFLAFLALLFLFFTFKETLPPEKRQKLDLQVAMKNYWVLLRNDRFLYYASISGLMFSGLMVNVSISPFYWNRNSPI